MNLYTKDINLLLVFHTLYEELNATRAAQRMSLSQPALSHKLNKLRHEMGDSLFVRAARGLTATPRAHELARQMQPLIHQLRNFYEQTEGHDYLSRTESIRIYTTDYMEQALLPHLLPLVRQAAPNVTIVTQNTRGRLPRQELETGECDIAIAGFYSDLPDTLRQQRLIEEPFKVLAARDNPHVIGGFSLDDYLECEHLLTTLTGDLKGLVDQKLAELGRERSIVAGLSSFIVPTRLLTGTRWLLTCLRSIAEQATVLDDNLVILEPPLDLPNVQVMQIWHERTDADPMRRWLRNTIQEVLQRVCREHSS
ncbi:MULTISPECIES: LysR family transcriptional regulator [Idiomarina]|jgi:DNA-binding transcriptional LysR family regulator|uniref:LysR family transcriptional regulator n=1 Tax=Idiomarina TaxID=135575 RepID=UPI00079649FB|nr:MULTISPECIES: LysR family transcriptional regulator [Idiomarina]KXS34109.1 MAG: LysR family transcriptional regulator [Idiomarina sp. T82-3]MBL73201.1 LysR family transcriptional regulator [Idiomarinaceae bacterium]|tara:strand:- start:1352 stop:2281 length:930 start_codon:yes stop_codon:yes gene_type:complete